MLDEFGIFKTLFMNALLQLQYPRPLTAQTVILYVFIDLIQCKIPN